MDLRDKSLLSQLPQENMRVLPRDNDQMLVSQGGAFRHPGTERRAHIVALYTNLAAMRLVMKSWKSTYPTPLRGLSLIQSTPKVRHTRG